MIDLALVAVVPWSHNAEAKGLAVDKGTVDGEGDVVVVERGDSSASGEGRASGDIVAIEEVPEMGSILILEVEHVILILHTGAFNEDMEVKRVVGVLLGEVVGVIGGVLDMAADHELDAIGFAVAFQHGIIVIDIGHTFALVGLAIVNHLVVTSGSGGGGVFVFAASGKEHGGSSHKKH